MKTSHRAGIRAGTWASSLVAVAAVASAAERPNIILMLADDQGWDGLSVAMAPDAPGSRGQVFHTPNLEKFAAQGMRFSNAYAPAPKFVLAYSMPVLGSAVSRASTAIVIG